LKQNDIKHSNHQSLLKDFFVKRVIRGDVL